MIQTVFDHVQRIIQTLWNDVHVRHNVLEVDHVPVATIVGHVIPSVWIPETIPIPHAVSTSDMTFKLSV